MNKIVILDNIRSVHNTGSIFRTADVAGVDMIYLCGYTPQPIDRFERERKDFNKVSLGAEKTVEWKHFENTIDALEELKENNFTIIAIEQAENSTDYKKVKTSEKTAFVFGNEPSGISKEVLDKCDIIAEIPMKGEKESLNVSVSAGIALFRMLGI
ncbi:MAG: RNA methyltransferase [Candidatus Pacebacteria bacterium]|nr:RNA methyltransferase [Candidatus Paceibacterota bacterium]